MTRDMTTGSPLRHILVFFLPVLAGNLFQQLYNVSDSVIVGRFVGVGSLAAVGSAGSLCFLVIGFVIGLCSGFSIPVARCYGAKDMRGVRVCITNQLYLGGAITVILTAATVLSARFLLTVMKTPADIMEDALSYLVIIFAGIGATMLYNMLACICRAVGDSRTPLYFLVLASLLNIGLDLLFILAFHQGTAGVAYATVTAQAVSALLCFLYMYRKFPELHMKKGEWKPDLSVMADLLHMGFPMAFQFSITAVGAIILQTAINPLGSGIVASVTAAQKVQMILTQPLDAMGATIATFASQNLGARKLSRISEGVRKSLITATGIAVAASIILISFGPAISRLFIAAEETEILAWVSEFLLRNGVFIVFLGVLLVLRNALQGIGFAVPAMMAGFVELVARSLVGIVFVSNFGFLAICYANPTAWIMACFFLVPMYLYAVRRLKHQIPDEPDEPEPACPECIPQEIEANP